MQKSMFERPVKAVVLLLGLFFLIARCPSTFAQDEDPGQIAQQLEKLYQEGKYQEAVPIAERLLAIRERNWVLRTRRQSRV